MADLLTRTPVTDGANRGAAIQLRDLTKKFGSFTAVDRVSLDIAPGEVLALLGPNGAGKTTTIKMMTGLVTPTSGRARLGGFDIGRQRSQAVAQIGAVLEGSRNVYWSLPAWQNLLYFGRLKGLRAAEIKPRAAQLLRDLGLWERRNQQVGGFSRGMQQKVAIAAALVTDPAIVLLDEPTIGLDVEAARTVRAWVRRLAHQDGKTIVLTTHQLAMAEELSDRVAVIRDGRVITHLATGQLLNRYVEDRFEVTAAGDPARIASVAPADATLSSAEGQVTIGLPSSAQDVLYEVLAGLRAGDVTVLGVNRVRPSLEEVFVQLVRGE